MLTPSLQNPAIKAPAPGPFKMTQNKSPSLVIIMWCIKGSWRTGRLKIGQREGKGNKGTSKDEAAAYLCFSSCQTEEHQEDMSSPLKLPGKRTQHGAGLANLAWVCLFQEVTMNHMHFQPNPIRLSHWRNSRSVSGHCLTAVTHTS